MRSERLQEDTPQRAADSQTAVRSFPARLADALEQALSRDQGAELDAFEPVFAELGWKGSLFKLADTSAIVRHLYGTDGGDEAWVRQQLGAEIPLDAVPAIAHVARSGRVTLIRSDMDSEIIAPFANEGGGRRRPESGLRPALRVDTCREAWAPVVTTSGMSHVLGVQSPLIDEQQLPTVSLVAQHLGIALSHRELAELDVAADESDKTALSTTAETYRALARKLRNPLMSLLRATSALHRRLLDAPTLDALTRQQQQAEYRMTRVIDNLLDLSEPVRAWREPTPLDVVIYSALASVRLSLDDAHRDRPVQLDMPCPAPIVWADPVLLSHALINVLANAFEHSGDRGQIQLSIERWSGSDIRIRVSNEGRSIPPSIAESVFEVQNTQANHGLGLAVVRRLVDAMGGRVALDPTQRGTSLSIWLSDAEQTESARRELASSG